MAASQSTRLAIYTWSAGTDTFTRDQMTTSHSNLEARVSGYNQDGSRPAAATAYKGFFHYSSTDSSAGTLSYCNGTAWFNIGSLGSTTPTALDGSGAAGSSQEGSRSDHKHAISNDAISNAMIADNAVQAAQINADAVTTVKILNSNVTHEKIENSAANSVLGRSTNSSGVVADISTSTNGEVLRLSGTTLGFGKVGTLGLANDAVTNAILDSTDGSEAVSTDTIQDGAVTALKLATDAVTTDKIDDDNVTLAKLAHTSAGFTILAKADTGAGALAELAAGNDSVLRRDGSGALAFGTIDSAHITDGTLMNADISTSADIAAAKLADNDIGDLQLDNADCSFYAKSAVGKTGNKVWVETDDPESGDGDDGDIWLKYS